MSSARGRVVVTDGDVEHPGVRRRGDPIDSRSASELGGQSELGAYRLDRPVRRRPSTPRCRSVISFGLGSTSSGPGRPAAGASSTDALASYIGARTARRPPAPASPPSSDMHQDQPGRATQPRPHRLERRHRGAARRRAALPFHQPDRDHERVDRHAERVVDEQLQDEEEQQAHPDRLDGGAAAPVPGQSARRRTTRNASSPTNPCEKITSHSWPWVPSGGHRRTRGSRERDRRRSTRSCPARPGCCRTPAPASPSRSTTTVSLNSSPRRSLLCGVLEAADDSSPSGLTTNRAPATRTQSTAPTSATMRPVSTSRTT